MPVHNVSPENLTKKTEFEHQPIKADGEAAAKLFPALGARKAIQIVKLGELNSKLVISIPFRRLNLN